MNPKFLLCLVVGTACSIAAALYSSPEPSTKFSDEPPAEFRARVEHSRDRSTSSPAAMNSSPALPKDAIGSTSSASYAHSFSQSAVRISSPGRSQKTPRHPSATSSAPVTLRAAAAPQSPAPPSTASVSSGEGLLVPLGASLPAPLVDPGDGATSAQVNMLDRISDDFVRRVEAGGGDEAAPLKTDRNNTGNPAQRPANWDAATREADERYRQLFGVEAYNARTSAAAREGLQELKTANGH